MSSAARRRRRRALAAALTLLRVLTPHGAEPGGPQVDMGGRVARVAGRVCTPLFPVVPGTQWRPRECV